MTLSEILKKYRADYNLTQQQFADKCNLSKGYISMLENKFKPTGRKNDIVPSIQAIRKISKGTGIDFEELLSSIDGEVSLVSNDQVKSVNIIYDDYFPLNYCTNLSAGSPTELLEAEPDAVVYVPIKFQNKIKRLHAFQVNGTSMNNVIPDRSIVVAEEVPDTILKEGTIVVAWLDGEATVKRIYPGDTQVTLMPDSSDKAHQPIIVNTSEEQIYIIGRVIWHMNPDDVEKYY